MDNKARILELAAMPIHKVDEDFDHYEIEGILASIKGITKDGDILIVTENIWGQPGSGTKQVFGFGDGYGYIRGLLHTWFHRDLRKVVPRVWQKWLFDLTSTPEMVNGNGKRDTKAMARSAICKLYPASDFRGSAKSINPHEGIIDAVGIARYALENLK